MFFLLVCHCLLVCVYNYLCFVFVVFPRAIIAMDCKGWVMGDVTVGEQTTELYHSDHSGTSETSCIRCTLVSSTPAPIHLLRNAGSSIM